MEITENKLKEILTDQRNEYQHFMGIMKEDLDSKIQLIGEQLSSHTEMISSLMEDVTIIKTDVQFLKAELKRKVDYDEFDALARRVSLLESKIKK